MHGASSHEVSGCAICLRAGASDRGGAEHEKDGETTLQDRTQKEHGNLRRISGEVFPIPLSLSLLWPSDFPFLVVKPATTWSHNLVFQQPVKI